MEKYIYIAVAIAALFFFIVVIIRICRIADRHVNEKAARAAGRQGEKFATTIIKEVLREGDYLFTNVSVEYDGKETELDNVIVNRNGVFIIEVKNYHGTLYGREKDFEWKKYHITPAGNMYEKDVKNPIKQVNRQVYILSRNLSGRGISVWVEGYVFFVMNNSPVKSRFILESRNDIDRAIHNNAGQSDKKTVKEIVDFLSKKI